ncbi:MAG: acyltransferase [Anaerolineae bacterium]|nr:acyltransferase [Anaerolineae bacterium]
MKLLHQARQTPWKAWLELRRYMTLPLARLTFALNGVAWQSGWRIYGAPIIQRHAGSTIRIGRNLTLRSWYASNPLGVVRRTLLCTWARGAELLIGDSVGMTGAVIVAQTRIEIGDHVWIGANSTIIDTDFHPLSPEARRVNPNAGKSAPILIEDEVFIGMWAIILKGVRIGRGAVVGAGAVVTSDVPAGAVVAGNPAQVVRQLVE